MFGINSMRRTCEECKVNLAYRWYLGLSINDDIPNYSTWSQNYLRRYHGTEIFRSIFMKILRQAEEYVFIDVSNVYGDGTHQKACANKNKYEDKEIEIEAKAYSDELLREINEETGLKNIIEFTISNNELVPIDIDTHLIDYNRRLDLPEHYHFEFRYLYVIDKIENINVDSNESSEYRWISVEELKQDENFGKIADKFDLLNLKNIRKKDLVLLKKSI